jgi:lipopolysaccharide biosynthesis protein
MQQAKTADPRPALVVHGYHLEALEELLSPLCGPHMALYLSTPAEQVERAERICRTLGWREAEVVPAENRGRDMAPFVLDLLPRVLANGHPWLLKLHTKRSDHLDAGRAWAAHLQGSLASAATCRSFGDWFRTDPTAGLLAAPGTLLPSTISLDRNVVHLRWLLDALELPTAWWLDQPFVAGSMYAVRSAALAPLLTLQLNRDQFEAEQGQRDGTLAHALERLVAALVIRQGFTLRALSGDAQAVPPFGYGWAAPA